MKSVSQQKRMREDGVPTLSELAQMIRDVDVDFLNAYLKTVAETTTKLDEFAALGQEYYKKVKVLSMSADFVNNVTDEQQLQMEKDIDQVHKRLQNIQK